MKCSREEHPVCRTYIGAENVLTGNIRKLTLSGPNPVRMPTLQAMRGLCKSSWAQKASRVEPRNLRPMHCIGNAWDFCFENKKMLSRSVQRGQILLNAVKADRKKKRKEKKNEDHIKRWFCKRI